MNQDTFVLLLQEHTKKRLSSGLKTLQFCLSFLLIPLLFLVLKSGICLFLVECDLPYKTSHHLGAKLYCV